MGTLWGPMGRGGVTGSYGVEGSPMGQEGAVGAAMGWALLWESYGALWGGGGDGFLWGWGESYGAGGGRYGVGCSYRNPMGPYGAGGGHRGVMGSYGAGRGRYGVGCSYRNPMGPYGAGGFCGNLMGPYGAGGCRDVLWGEGVQWGGSDSMGREGFRGAAQEIYGAGNGGSAGSSASPDSAVGVSGGRYRGPSITGGGGGR